MAVLNDVIEQYFALMGDCFLSFKKSIIHNKIASNEFFISFFYSDS
jgi:hypothetical protein